MLPLINIKKDCVNKHHGSVTAAWRVQIATTTKKKKKKHFFKIVKSVVIVLLKVALCPCIYLLSVTLPPLI